MIPATHPRCVSFSERDSEYPDLDCSELVANRYLRLVSSADYRSESRIAAAEMDTEFDHEVPGLPHKLILPHNLITEGKRLTSSVELKILGALAICPLPSTFEIRTYQLFHMVKWLGYRYNYKSHRWEQG